MYTIQFMYREDSDFAKSDKRPSSSQLQRMIQTKSVHIPSYVLQYINHLIRIAVTNLVVAIQVCMAYECVNYHLEFWRKEIPKAKNIIINTQNINTNDYRIGCIFYQLGDCWLQGFNTSEKGRGKGAAVLENKNPIFQCYIQPK